MALIRKHEQQVDGFLVTCMDDPNLDAVKEVTAKPVLDGVVCGLIILAGMVRAGISTSKIGRYRPRQD